MGFRVYTLLTCTTIAGFAFGQVTGNVSIPTADVIGEREGELGYALTSMNANFNSRYGSSSYFLFGPLNSWEIAVGTDFAADPGWGFKWNFWQNERSGLALGAGLQGVGPGMKSSPFFSARKAFDVFNVHAGIQEVEGDRQGFFGVDWTMNEKVVLGADHIAGSMGSTSVGAWYDLGSGFTLNGAVFFPNQKSEPRTHSLSVAYGFRF
ncbi:MAG: hypothetical protein KDC26_09275 [Armatimonadetes bacterium]|nr:hypothetical protein [Armatimonadota bacterium]